eukprot:8760581-Alexandrium_andersonii.AAC.1
MCIRDSTLGGHSPSSPNVPDGPVCGSEYALAPGPNCSEEGVAEARRCAQQCLRAQARSKPTVATQTRRRDNLPKTSICNNVHHLIL